MSHSFEDAMASFSPDLPLAVAFSGGADSSALLLACARKWPGQVVAIHVHHGLQSAADQFVTHCQAVCARLDVPLVVRHVDARHASGESPEDSARRARYSALGAALRCDDAGLACTSIALAHHADDQVESILLALSRGAGLPGLSGMPVMIRRQGVDFHRPLLAVSSAELRAWLRQQGLAHIEDPSNLDQGLTRNRIRATLLPALEAGFPQYRATFARTARHAAQAQALLQELAEEDLRLCGSAAGLTIARLQSLSPARQSNVLRHWFKSTHAVLPSEAQLRELLRQIAACRTRGHGISIQVANGMVGRRGADLSWYNAAPDTDRPG